MAGQAGTVGTPPSHYATDSGMQPFDVIDAYGMGFYDGNALKYLLRAGKKGHLVDDLKKALHYVQETIIRWERGEIIPTIPRKLTIQTYDVSIAFGLQGTHLASAVFYLLSWRCDTRPDEDIRAAARYIERAIRLAES